MIAMTGGIFIHFRCGCFIAFFFTLSPANSSRLNLDDKSFRAAAATIVSLVNSKGRYKHQHPRTGRYLYSKPPHWPLTLTEQRQGIDAVSEGRRNGTGKRLSKRRNMSDAYPDQGASPAVSNVSHLLSAAMPSPTSPQ